MRQQSGFSSEPVVITAHGRESLEADIGGRALWVSSGPTAELMTELRNQN